MSVEHPAVLPFRLGRYEVGAKIADGGMAAVYVARRDDGKVVAIKMIREEFARSREFVTMFLDEAKIVSRLEHPNIVRCYEVGRDGAQVYIAMQLLFGQSLWSVWEACRSRGTRLRYDTIAWIGARVAEGLHYAHELTEPPSLGSTSPASSGVAAAPSRSLDIVHRDVNATNLFVTYDGGIKIIDFGLAKAANRASKTAAGIIKGKVAYMSPEQAIGAPVDRRTDIFALGTTLWELACDRRLFKQPDEVETLKRVHAAEVPDPTQWVAGFPPSLWRVLERALARDREQRYATAAELARGLDDFVGGAVDASVVASVMRELFAEERIEQERLMAETSADGGGVTAHRDGSKGPFRGSAVANREGQPPSNEERMQPPAQAGAATPLGVHRLAPSALSARRRLARIVGAAVAFVLAAAVVAAVVWAWR